VLGLKECNASRCSNNSHYSARNTIIEEDNDGRANDVISIRSETLHGNKFYVRGVYSNNNNLIALISGYCIVLCRARGCEYRLIDERKFNTRSLFDSSQRTPAPSAAKYKPLECNIDHGEQGTRGRTLIFASKRDKKKRAPT